MKIMIRYCSFVFLPLLLLMSATFASTSTVQVDKGEFGTVVVEPFNPTWLDDYPNVKEHIQTEHLLHAMGLDETGKGLTWHKEKFVTSGGLDPLYAPNKKLEGAKHAGTQFKLPYFIVPKSLMKSVYSNKVSPEARKELEIYDEHGNVTAFRFFVHPEGFKHFKVLMSHPDIKYVSSETSEYMTSATSSYRSLVTRKVKEDESGNWIGAENSIPIIVKLGVAGEVLGSDRWLSVNEINRSVRVQRAFDSLSDEVFQGKNMKMYIFPESAGIFLDSEAVEGYPPKKMVKDDKGNEKEMLAKESGVLIREFPKEMIENKIQILSFSALMSVERVKPENAGLGGHNKNYPGFEYLPYIYELISFAKDKDLISSTEEYFQKYLIDGYIDSLKMVFEEGLTIEPHSQNFSIVLNQDYIPIGFAYRDHGGVTVDLLTRASLGKDIEMFRTGQENPVKTFKGKLAHTSGYINLHSWFYRYQVFNKILNTITKPEKAEDGTMIDMMSPPAGAPYQIGFEKPIPERNLYPYVVSNLPSDQKEQIVKQMEAFLLPPEKLNELLMMLDKKYYEAIANYFDMDKLQLKLEDGMLFSAEGGSGKEHLYDEQHKGFTMSHKGVKDLQISHEIMLSDIPEAISTALLDRMITTRNVKALEDLKIDKVGVGSSGLWFFSKDKEVAFMPYLNMNEKLSFQQMKQQ